MLGLRMNGLFAVSLVFILVCCMNEAGAERLRVQSGLDLTAQYSDNVFLTKENKREEYIIIFSPKVWAQKSGRRGLFSVGYAPQLRMYAEGTQANEFVHFLDANFDIELIDRVFGIETIARAGQSIIDRDQNFTPDGIINTDNITNTYSLRISPYLLPIRLARYAILTVKTDLDVVVNSDSQAANSSGNKLNMSLVGGPAFNNFGWSLNVGSSQVRIENEADKTIYQATLNSLYRVNSLWALSGQIGYDENNINNASDGSWQAGVYWTPNGGGATSRNRPTPNDLTVRNANERSSARTSLFFGYGNRFGDTDYQVQFNHRHRKTSWILSYYRTLEASRDDFLNQGIFPGIDEFGNDVTDPLADDNAQTSVITSPARRDSFAKSDRFNLAFWLDLKRTSARVNVGYVRRDDLEIDDVTEDTSLQLQLTRDLATRTKGELNLRWLRRFDEQNTNNDYDQYSIGLTYKYYLYDTVQLRLTYGYTDKVSDNSNAFSENRVMLELVNSANYRTNR